MSEESTIKIKGIKNLSTIYCNNSINNLNDLLKNRNCVFIIDKNVNNLYKSQFETYKKVIVEASEENKSLKTVENIFEQFLNVSVDRNTFIVAVGGGITLDIAGFAASTFMRGLNFGFVPTTLLAQVDASIGGKNGVNFQSYKNIVGNFNQPEFVLIDYKFLKTLSKKEILCGLGEILKHGLIKDENLFNYLIENYSKILKINESAINTIVYKSLIIKSDIVKQDEMEKGVRKLLNFGHTIAHGIEKIETNYSHGEAVAIGIKAASFISYKLDKISKSDYEKILTSIKNLGLPSNYNFSSQQLLNAISFDKKKNMGKIDFILLNKIGNGIIEPLTLNEIKGYLNDLC